MIFHESSHLELKEQINADFKKEIIAFANTDGGEIYVGVNRDGIPVGLTQPEQDMERISSMIRDGIHPDLLPFTSIERVRVDEKDLIHITVTRGGRPPYHLSDRGLKPSGVYIRHGVASIPASEEMIRELIRESDGTTYDQARSLNQDLTFHYATQYFAKRNVGFLPENQRTLGILDRDHFYTNTALLLSDQCEHSIKCAVFDGTNKLVFQTRKEFFGSILKQLEEAYEYISLFNHIHADFEGLVRIEQCSYPEYALREALLNTIIHRDYNYSGDTIVNIFSNRMEFVSIGGLVKGLTLPDIMHGVSQSRNRILANVFYRLHLIESYGTGIQRIVESYAESGLQPSFLPEAASFVTVLPNRNHPAEVSKQMSLHKGSADSPAAHTIIRETMPVYGNTAKSPEEQVLQLLESGQLLTRKEIQTLLQFTEFPTRKLLSSLLEQGKIYMVGKGRSTRYRRKEE